MSNNRFSLPVKTAAFLLMLFALVAGGLCSVAACFLADQGAYTLSRQDMVEQGLQSRIADLATGIADAYAQETYGNTNSLDAYAYYYDGRYSMYPQAYQGESNYRYTIRDGDRNVLKSNYQDEPYLAMREAVVTDPTYSLDGQYRLLGQELVVTGYVLDEMEVDDDFSYFVKVVNTFYASRVTLVVVALICLAAVVCLVVYLVSAAGHRPGREEIVLNPLDRIPTDLYLGAVLLGLGALLSVLNQSGFWRAWIQLVTGGIVMALGGAMCMAFAMSLATRLKYGHGYWWRHSILGFLARQCRKLLRTAWRGVRALYRLLPVIWRWILWGGGLILLTLVLLNPSSTGMGMLIYLGIWFGVLLYLSWALGKLHQSALRMAQGDLQEPVSPRYLVGVFRQMAESLNALSKGASLAVERQLKSERLKTELITNVSHDIKTPLTSIVNYVDLLQKPHTPQQGEQYLEVLDRQAQRLKKLTEDLVELSKAASGSIPVNLAPTDVSELVHQALAEYQLKMEKAGLSVVLSDGEQGAWVQADGRLLWRVMDNLLSNCVKYALAGTRVYVDVVKLEKKVMISIKNVSQAELNLPAEELMERFVRGDRARNLEGSGLGLNIAKTLMELQHGSLNLYIDGDLFKAMLLFDAMPAPEA